jgi:hypothetical protein
MVSNLDSKYERDFTEPTYPNKFQATCPSTRTNRPHRPSHVWWGSRSSLIIFGEKGLLDLMIDKIFFQIKLKEILLTQSIKLHVLKHVILIFFNKVCLTCIKNIYENCLL